MNTVPEMDLNLEKLFLPAWAQEAPEANRYAHHTGGEDRPERNRDSRPGRRPQRREPQGERRDNRERGRDTRPPRSKDRRGPGRRDDFQPRERPEPPPPLPDVNVALLPDDQGVESLARQIKSTGRAYPLFGIAQIILQKPERFAVKFSVKKGGDGSIAQPLFVCALDDTLWLSEDEVVSHVLRNHFATFYQAEKTATEPPKGTYTFVAQCGMSGVILGPPNHHDYQNQLRKLHAERFGKMPFDAFKSRVKIVRDEAVVKKWVEDQSWKTEYVCLNVPEPLKLANMEELEKHFCSVHKEAIVKKVEDHKLGGVQARGMRCVGLARLARQVVEDQRRFPLQIATVLSQRFNTLGLQFFKVNKTVTHVSVARPSFLDLENTPVSDGIKRIVEFINGKPRCTRRQLVETLAPSPQPAAVEVQPAAEGAETPAAKPSEPTPEQTAIIADLHWLIHQGHVIEFADGRMETAKKPAPKPPKPAAKTEQPSSETATAPGQPPAQSPETETATVTTETIATPVSETTPDSPVESSLPETSTETVPSAETVVSESAQTDIKA